MEKPILKSYNNDISRNWYVEFKDENGTRRRVSKGTDFGLEGDGNRFKKKGERKEFFKQLIDAITKHYETPNYVPKIVPITTLAQAPILEKTTCLNALNSFISAKRLHGLSEDTLKDYFGRCSFFLRQMGLQELPIVDFTRDKVLDFLQTQQHNGHTNYNHYIAALSNWGNYLVEKKHLETNPAIGISYRIGTVKSNVAYSVEDVKRILAILHDRAPMLYIACLFEYYCFMRPREIVLLRWSDIDFINDKVTVRSENAKDRSTRVLPIHKVLKKALLQYHAWLRGALGPLAECNFVFTHPETKERVANKYFTGRFKFLKNELDLKEGETFYGMKHTGCRELYLKTKDIYLVSMMCGHKNIITTQIYLRSLGLDVNFLDNSVMDSIV